MVLNVFGKAKVEHVSKHLIIPMTFSCKRVELDGMMKNTIPACLRLPEARTALQYETA